MTSTVGNRVSENTSFKCPTCNAVHLLKTVVIGDRTFRVNDAREVFGVTTECPVCLDECSGFMVSPCGHILCKDDYQKMGGMMPTSYDSAIPRRAVRASSRSVDPPSMTLVRRESTAATQNGATVHEHRSRRLDVTTTTVLSTVNSTESEVARPVTNLPTTSGDASLTFPAVGTYLACTFLSIHLPLFFERPHPMAYTSVLIIYCVFVAIEIVDEPELPRILQQTLKPAFITYIYTTWLVFIIDQIVGMKLDILVELKIIWAFGTLSILLLFTGIFVRGKSFSTMEFLLLTFGIGLSHFFIFDEVKHFNY